MVKCSVDKTLTLLERRKSSYGPWMKRINEFVTDIPEREIITFNKKTKEPFLNKLHTKITERYILINITK